MSLVLLIFFADLAATPPIYRWIDENGTIHLSDRPPSGVAAVTVETPLENTVDAWKSETIESAGNRRIKERSRPARPQDSARKLKADQCHKARRTFERIREKLRSGYKASEGRELKNNLRSAQADLRFYCGTFR